MEGSSYKEYLGYIAAFAIGAITYKFLFPGPPAKAEKNENKKDGKKVSFYSDVEKQEELKEMIRMTVKETLVERTQIKSKNQVATSSESQRRRYSLNDEPIYKICFTGGPCAGKTTALSQLMSQVDQLGFRPFLVPEAATLLMKAGFLIDNSNFTEMDEIIFQSSLMKAQIFLEDLTLEYASGTSNKPVIIF